MDEKTSGFVETLRKQLKAELKRYDYPSAAIGIVKDGEVIMSEGIGLRDVAGEKEADNNTIYHSGSCGKAYTVALIDILVDRGKLSWDTPIVSYCPELAFADPYVTAKVTLRDLLSHRTGLPRHDLTWYNTARSKTEVVMNMRYMELNMPFRTTFQYSNQSYMMAGYIIERITGMSYEECLKKMIFEPLGMDHAAIFTDEVLSEPDHALPYDRPGNPYCFEGQQEYPIVSPPAEDLEKRIGDASNPAGCISLSVEDSLKWIQMLLNQGKTGEKQFIKAETLQENFKPNILINDPSQVVSDYSYGMGWFLGTYQGERIAFHGGNVPGFTTLTFLWPGRNIGMILFTNFSVTNLGYATMYTILDHELGIEGSNWFDTIYSMTKEAFANMVDDPLSEWKALKVLSDRVEGTLPSNKLEAYCGTYSAPGYDSIDITLQEGSLYFNGWCESEKLAHYDYDTFVIADHGSIFGKYFPVFFHMDASNGSVKSLAIHPNREENASDIRFEKIA